jgi:hypothetical protein
MIYKWIVWVVVYSGGECQDKAEMASSFLNVFLYFLDTELDYICQLPYN